MALPVSASVFEGQRLALRVGALALQGNSLGDAVGGQLEGEVKVAALVPSGPEVIRKQNPLDRPNRPKRSPAPLFHAASKEVRWAMWEVYGTFVAAFREAAEKLKRGDLTVAFPSGSFPPPRQFVPA